MDSGSKTKEVWEKARVWECFSTDDKLVWTPLANVVVAKCNGGAKCTDLETGEVLGRIDLEDDPVVAVAVDPEGLDPDNQELVTFTAHKSGLVRKWLSTALLEPHPDAEGMRVLKGDHRGPILHMLTALRSRYLITVGSDFMVKVWDTQKRHLLGILRGITSVVICCDLVVVSGGVVHVACGLADGAVKTWTLTIDDDELSCNTAALTLDKHNSQISSLNFCSKETNSSSGDVSDSSSDVTTPVQLTVFGRDQLMSVWNVKTQECLHLVPTYEEIEMSVVADCPALRESMKTAGGVAFKEGHDYVLGAGERGKLRMWNVTSGTEVDLADTKVFKAAVDSLQIGGKITDVHVTSHALFTVREDLVVRTDLEADDLDDQSSSNLLVPMNQSEVLDFTVLDRKLVIATNAPYLRVYDFDSDRMGVASCAEGGHTDAVLAVASLKPLDKIQSDQFISCGKDQNICLWKFVENGASVKLVGKGTGHTSYVGAVAMSPDLLFSASKDGILKSWSVPEAESEDSEDSAASSLRTKRTIAAHQQEINCLDVSFDGEIVVSGSQDKTAKLWRASDLGLLATLTGHRRGIWSTGFFYEGNRLLLATASADATVKVWERNSFNDFACVHTLEGHLASVLGVVSLEGRKLATVSSDGLLKVWSFDNGLTEAVGSFDAHDDKIWALAAVQDRLVTGGRDGQMVVWQDVTERVKAEDKAKHEEVVKTDQKLSNYIQNGQLAKALKVCLRTGKPRMARETLDKLRKKGGNHLREALVKLSLEERNTLHGLLVKWNSYGPQCALAQDVLKVLLVEAMVMDQRISAAQCAGLIAFSDKHYQRLDKLHSKLSVVDLLLDNM